jgi:hypothetical protein
MDYGLTIGITQILQVYTAPSYAHTEPSYAYTKLSYAHMEPSYAYTKPSCAYTKLSYTRTEPSYSRARRLRPLHTASLIGRSLERVCGTGGGRR